MADVDVAHIETALAHPANGLMNRTVGGAPTDHRELSALLAEAHLLRCDGVGDAEHLVGAHFRHRLMVRRVIVDMASAHILLDTPYPVHQARRARLDPDARTLFVAGIGVYALTFSRRLIMEMDRERLVAAPVRHLPVTGRL